MYSIGKIFTKEDVFKDINNIDTYHSWHHHSSYSSLSVSSMVEKMNNDILAAHTNLIQAKILFITLGTARVHILKESNEIVSNCHKQPANLFDKKLLTTKQIVDNLRESFQLCQQFNPNLKVKEKVFFFCISLYFSSFIMLYLLISYIEYSPFLYIFRMM